MSEASSAEIIQKLKERDNKLKERDQRTTCCTLYTFAKRLYDCQRFIGVKTIKVARLTDGPPNDWSDWADGYMEKFPHLRLLEINGIEVIDDRSIKS